jgi:hypothetical protein
LSNLFRKAITVTNVIIGGAFPVRAHVYQIARITRLPCVGCLQIAYSDMFDTYVIRCPVDTDQLIWRCVRFQLVIHSVLASRILFRLRSSSNQVHETPLVMLSEDMRYQLPSHLQTNETRCEV